MKTLAIACLLVVAVTLAECARIRRDDKYTTRYDNINIDEILSNDRVLKNYIKCLLDQGPCTAEGSELKKTIPDALTTGCSKCNEKQKEAAKKVIKHLTEKKAEDWKKLEAKYDPEGIYESKYKKEYEDVKTS
uniref:Chemosensory protein n=1 Tax=Blattella germanica TaxID=6973 RepID=A0A109ZT31_BLAGE|nr:chemosensory protein [Blattella germanica]